MDKFLIALRAVCSTIVNLRFLPDKAQRWVFSTGTQAIEIANIAVLAGWALVMLIDGNTLLTLKPYMPFAVVGRDALTAIFFVLSAVLVYCMIRKSKRYLFLKGYVMILSGVIWGLVSAGFAFSYPPLSTAMTFYPVLAVLCWLCGENLIDRYKTEMK